MDIFDRYRRDFDHDFPSPFGFRRFPQEEDRPVGDDIFRRLL